MGLRGTHRGPLASSHAGRTVDVPGTTVLDVAGGAVRAAREYTDRQALLEQLGLQVVVQPPALGPLTFGTGLRVHHGQTSRPGALSLNVLDFGPEGEPGGTLQALGLPVVEELASTAGFLGLTIAGFGARAASSRPGRAPSTRASCCAAPPTPKPCAASPSPTSWRPR